ncbi:hypothetical protein [Streptomyces zingiberis]|uniref:WXG100 family type VII secretion target n=1 Tax=Streptomyces zingiberis TaxID=2053010 RepID=A0ABX1C4L3_9ACTN|nr:hypothetical protein [Streptomyces zingiberis]NJQ03603.1 hypothetical protein [Streptomyces zingiberis]
MSGNDSGDPTALRLNQTPGDPGGSPYNPPFPGGLPTFGSSPEQKRAAANAIEKDIEPDSRKAGDWAEEATESAVKAFEAKDGEGWQTSGALKKAHTTWGTQVTTLMNRLKSEKEALRATNTVFQNNDLGVGQNLLRPPSAFDGY